MLGTLGLRPCLGGQVIDIRQLLGGFEVRITSRAARATENRARSRVTGDQRRRLTAPKRNARWLACTKTIDAERLCRRPPAMRVMGASCVGTAAHNEAPEACRRCCA